MTYLEAATEILKAAGQPLHYTEITRRALENGLIEPKGKTPEATMGAQLYMAAKDEGDGTGPRFRQTGRGHFALVSMGVEQGLDRDIRTHNAKVEEELLDFLHEMHPRQVELLVGQLLTAIGFEDVAVTKYSGDGGIDVDATLTVGGVTKVKTAIQVKRWKNNVSGSTVRELRGGLMTDQRGLIITTARFTKDAIAESDASGKTPISLIDGARLVQLLVERQIGVRKKSIPLLELNLSELVSGDEEPGGTGEKSAALLWLPGGKEHYFDNLLKFLDFIGAKKPRFDELAEWVMATFDTVTKRSVVQASLSSVLYSIGLCDFDGERIVLTEQGEALREKRSKDLLVELLRANVLGVEELLQLLQQGPVTMEGALKHLVEKLNLSWNTTNQVMCRLQWLQACGYVANEGKEWRLLIAAGVGAA